MKSDRYAILPRVRKLYEGCYKCTWKDPGKLLQHRGKPLRFNNVFVGLGETPDAAIRECQRVYLKFLKDREATWAHIDKLLDEGFPGLAPLPYHSLGPSDFHIATSNLPWLKRLFRI